MQISIRLTVVVFFFLGSISLQAQDSTKIKLEKIPVRLLPVDNPFEAREIERRSNLQPANITLDNFQKDVVRRIADVYQLHVLSLEAQLNEDLIEAETYINEAVEASQDLLDDYPEIRMDRRFAELSRVVVSEYRSFYGITESVNEPEGEIFAIQEELFSDDDAFLDTDFSLPKDIT